MNKEKLLVVEDDPNLGQILKEYLEIKGYDTKLCQDGEQGLESFKNNHYDLCIFDVMLPKKDGFSLAREIKVTDKETPIIFLTAKSMKQDTIEGFKIGADDYITKPFSMEELLLRIKAILRRSNSIDKNNFEKQEFNIGKLTFNYDHHLLKSKTKEIKLTSKEAELLKLLCLNFNQTLERSVALKIIWRDDSYFNARSMDVYITKLRKYLKEDENLQILTVRGTGFKLVDLS
ncbi:response regulator transcription factor [Fulvivirgaceae bacterium BMA10]|uniref:Response regulator transcription factor n=1 Tax=Splendidivirga corallicola TaxID=3051826 RepID=A0ABT8KME1_9BACT|nr:response regulator transcription factor [Fulvivirgaceae bacterium BMA10]